MNYETNSKLVKENDIFVCIKGNHYDGHDFINDVKDKATLIISERKLDKNIKYKKVSSTKKYLTKVLSKENKKLTKDFTIIGITGTKGKTTTAFMIYEMLNKLKYNIAYIGTLGLYYKNNYEVLENTTPDILTLNKTLKKLKKENIKYIVMEVSSIALMEERIKGLKFKTCVFTNFSQDHLDYHGNMKNYLKAKLQILKYLNGNIILNDDDTASIYFKRKTRRYKTIGTNGILKLLNINLNSSNLLVSFSYNYDNYNVYIPFVGKFNAYNYLCSIMALLDLGIDIKDVLYLSNFLKPVKGRGDIIRTKNGNIIIDYAHSPESVKSILEAYQEIKKGRIITIIGCGGNRDKTKRPIMANISCTLSDYVIFTSDNPREEKEEDILKDMTKDLKHKNYTVIKDREKAIKKGIHLIHKNDCLLILGKGHEDYQIIGNTKYHFDDKEIVTKYI